MKSIKKKYQNLDSAINKSLDWLYENHVKIEFYLAKTAIVGGGLTLTYAALSRNPNPAVIAAAFTVFGAGVVTDLDASLKLMRNYKSKKDTPLEELTQST